MIGSLRGTLLDRSPRGELLVEVGGVGYRVSAPSGTLAAVGPSGSPVFLHVHTHVRDDAIVLYGFGTADERQCFEVLIGTHGVGPALALAILSALSPVALRRAVANEDVDALVGVPGVGLKTARRLVMELKSQLGEEAADDPGLVAAGPGLPGPRAEVQAALISLGYGADEVRHALREVGETSAEDMLRSALRQMAAVR